MKTQADPSGYHLLKTYKIPGDTFWDYLEFDPATDRLFVSHGTHVVVMDAKAGGIVGNVEDTPGVHGIVLAPEFNRGFATAGGAAKLVIFDLKTLKVIGSAPTDKDCDGVAYDPASKRVFAMNGDSQSSTVVDAKTGTVDGTIALGGGPEFPVADGRGHVYVNLETTSEILEIDSHSLKILHRWPLAPGKSPSGLAMDTAHRVALLRLAKHDGDRQRRYGQGDRNAANRPWRGRDPVRSGNWRCVCVERRRRHLDRDSRGFADRFPRRRERENRAEGAHDGPRSKNAQCVPGYRADDAYSQSSAAHPALQDGAGFIPCAGVREGVAGGHQRL